MADIDATNLIVFSGCCCCFNALFCTTPDCIGCSGKSECLCLIEEFCCRSGADMLWCTAPEGACCQLGCGCCAIACKSPTTCCKSKQQCCCLVGQGAFPCDAEIPCVVAAWFLSCYPKCGCCIKFGDYKDQAAK